jgi:IMP dehydrogenase
MAIEHQAAEVQRVKRSQSGMITDPVTLPPTAALHEAEALMHRFKFSGVPITDGAGRLVGILTNRDIRFCEGTDFDRPITEFMTSDGLVTAPVGTTLDEAKSILQRHRIEKLPLVDGAGRLVGLITVKDIQKRHEFPNATRDDAGRLRCAAAVGVGDDVEARVEALVAMGTDAVVIDTAHGHSAGVIKAIERIKGGWPDLPVVAGNVVTEDGVDALADAGADAIKVGVGAGSICTTRVISGAGMPQLSAIWHTTRRARRRGVPVVADGGVTYSGDIVKAIAAGAETVMLGSLLAGTEESPGELELFEGRRYKSYRGMGSMGAMQGLGADRYATGQGSTALGAATRKLVPEGIEGRVPYAGSLGEVLYQLVGGVRSGMGYAGAATLESLRTGARFMRVTAAGREESHPHDVQITNEAPNYQRG